MGEKLGISADKHAVVLYKLGIVQQKHVGQNMDNLGKHLHGGLTFTENDVASHATDLFRPIAQEVSMKSSSLIHINPVSMNQTGPYDFKVIPRGDQYVQMSQIRLYMRAKVTTDAGAAIVDADAISICNLFGNSMFQTIDIEIGGKTITDLQNSHSNYKAYLETLLSYTPDAGKGPLGASHFWMDEAGSFDDIKYGVDATATVGATWSRNDGFRARSGITKQSRLFDMMIPIHSDLFNCDRLLPPGVDLTLKLTRSKDSFVLMHPESTKSFKITLSAMKLVVPYITVADAIVANHKAKILTTPVLLPIKKTDILVHHVGVGGSLVQISNLFQNRLPKTLIIGMLETESYNGASGKNPYNFQHFDVNYVTITRNGVMIPSEPYTPDWDAKLYNREYRSFFDNIGIGTDNIGSIINRSLYAGGASLFAFDMTPDRCNGYHWHKREEGGAIDIDLRFKTALAKGTTIMLFGVYDALVAIDKDMNVAVSY